jgi:hypothetical protein
MITLPSFLSIFSKLFSPFFFGAIALSCQRYFLNVSDLMTKADRWSRALRQAIKGRLKQAKKPSSRHSACKFLDCYY